jgi:hypothetical protein
MKKLLALTFLSLLAAGLSQSFAAAGWFHHCCHDKLNACASQYNAFSPFCVTGVSASKHCHKCNYPAEGPCCPRPNCGPEGWCEPGCSSSGCADGTSGTLGVLPAPAPARVQPTPGSAQVAPNFAPPAPSPMPIVPGTTSYLFPAAAPAGMIQPAAYQPSPWYWNMGN